MTSSSIFRDDLLAGTVALITGGGTGIGRRTAFEMGRLGARIAIVARRQEPLDATVAALRDEGIDARCYVCDIRDADAIQQTVANVIADFGTIDVLFNNAGGQFFQPSLELSPNGWRAVVETNLTGTFLMSQAVAKQAMVPRRSGLIVNMAINMWRGLPAAAHSSAARAGIVNLTRTLSVEWAAHKIRVNCVAPGSVETEGLDQYPDSVVRQLRSVIPLKTMGQPEDIAWMICYLASEAGRWITGETICIDGGSQNWGSMWQIPDDPDEPGGYRS
ncbi:MAG: SDR family oxidoreductase [Candidatus Dadabacteria bacterium]|nr:MAG: SDR family oxidoreductase [Candidatus Dadabacteria bacterium]